MTEDMRNDIEKAIDRLYAVSTELVAKTNEYLLAKNRQLTAELEQVKRERDAAVWELGSGKSCCASCKHDDTRGRDEPCRTCLKSLNFFDTPSRYEWRGPCAENGGAEDE